MGKGKNVNMGVCGGNLLGGPLQIPHEYFTLVSNSVTSSSAQIRYEFPIMLYSSEVVNDKVSKIS